MKIRSGETILLDRDSAEEFSIFIWRFRCDRFNRRVIRGGSYAERSLARLIAKPEPGQKLYVINSNPLDLRRSNLSTQAPDKLFSKKKTAAEDFKGVRNVGSSRNPYQAFVEVAGVTKVVGNYATLEAAAAARDCAVLELFGEDYQDLNL